MMMAADDMMTPPYRRRRLDYSLLISCLLTMLFYDAPRDDFMPSVCAATQPTPLYIASFAIFR